MQVSFLLVGVLPVLLVAAAIFDLTSYTIPNILSGAMLVLFLIFLLAMALSGHALSWGGTSSHVIAGVVGLVAGMVLFALRLVGGGDAKFFAATCLWIGWQSMLEYAAMASVAGLFLTLALLTLRRFPWLPVFVKLPWLLRLADPRGDVPYGVALAAGALIVLPGTELFRLVSAI